MDDAYLHGYNQQEQQRLIDQAKVLEEKVFSSLDLAGIRNLFEPGIGVGAEAEIILRRYPNLKITGIDISLEQLDAAKKYLGSFDHTRSRFEMHLKDATDTGFKDASFDGAFFCWVLEHIPDPLAVLKETHRVLADNGRIFITEVFNPSFFLSPASPAIMRYWKIFNDHQKEINGHPEIGIVLGNLLKDCGFRDISLTPRTFLFGNESPAKRKQFLMYWKDLMLSASSGLIKSNLVSDEELSMVDEEFQTLLNDPQSIFYYTFIQATAIK